MQTLSNQAAKQLADVEVVANTDYYTISYSYKKNRFYLTIRGFWQNQDVI